MANFFVGQRVRVVDAAAHPEFVGMETRIAGVAYGEYAEAGYEWVVLISGEEWGACSRHLEPILPEGHRPSEFTTLADLLESLEVTA